MQFFQARTYAPSAANRMHLRSRPAALSAKDFICLKTIHDAIEGVMKSCVAGTVTARNARYAIMKLALLRKLALLFCPKPSFALFIELPKTSPSRLWKAGMMTFMEPTKLTEISCRCFSTRCMHRQCFAFRASMRERWLQSSVSFSGYTTTGRVVRSPACRQNLEWSTLGF